MNLRKNRTHLSGSSNLATKTETVRPATTLPYQTRPATGFSTKRGTADEVIEFRTQRAVVTPFEKTRSFYNESGKTERPKTKIGEPRKLQLEDPDKMKMPFTGESELLFDKNLGKYRDPDSPARNRRNTLNREKEHLAKEKHEEHSKAIQETQLVGYDKYNLDTLKNNINLEKVREAKRIIRRKYGNRKNLHAIFVAWDYDRTGYITVDNLYAMAKRLGLNLNVDEARVLLATADRKGSATLGLDEFFDLINNNEDVINVDLTKLSRNLGDDYLVRKEKLESEDDNIIKKLEDDAKRTREVKHMNQVNLILKNKLQEVSVNFLKSDYTNKGYTTYDVFEQNIKRLGIDDKLITNQDIRALYDKYKNDDHTLNYRKFVDGLKSFTLVLEDIYREQERLPLDGAIAKSKQIDERQMDEKEVQIVDFRTLPYSTAYQFLAKKRKISRLIQKFFPKQEDLKDYLAKTLKQGDASDMEFLTKRETKDSMIALFKKFDVSNLTARDFEGFLSSFVYNQQGLARVNDVLTSIYVEDEDAFIKNINDRKKGAPPQGVDAFDKEALARRNSEVTLSTLAYDEKQNKKKLNEILKIVDDRLFTNRVAHYDLFKKFDVDGDGYVSRKDFISKAKQMSLIPQEDLPILVNYLDPENKGYVNFREFNNKIRTHATDQDEKLKPIVPASTLPSKENWQRVADTLPDTQAKVTELYEKYNPQNYKTLRPTSRFGEAPAWKNTFTQMQAPINSPMFISERERFLRTPDARVLPTIEDNEKRRRIASARVDVIRQRMDTLQARVDADTMKQENLEQSRMRTKLASAIAHEQGAKVRNYK